VGEGPGSERDRDSGARTVEHALDSAASAELQLLAEDLAAIDEAEFSIA